MGSCTSCGSPVPDGQKSCSMCYGDPYHGSDGYLLAAMEEDQRQQWEAEEQAKRAEAMEEPPPHE